ncbi:hypothetical protein F511_26351 [Dorcoceras hygrometricum]|uniref:Uncharacterized protein n=1 Tax=Dorcoceras hygrometricum TaxID=472368 RepID=A0A2Z7CX26_9LAMI|nr:hypothetical protein F511_26351 [Dorcoceras hygrometricum]
MACALAAHGRAIVCAPVARLGWRFGALLRATVALMADAGRFLLARRHVVAADLARRRARFIACKCRPCMARRCMPLAAREGRPMAAAWPAAHAQTVCANCLSTTAHDGAWERRACRGRAWPCAAHDFSWWRSSATGAARQRSGDVVMADFF